MKKLSLENILENIEKQENFSAVMKDNSFSLTIEEYVPFVGATIHNGGNLRKTLRKKMCLDKFERWYEEDPLTNLFIASFPIRIVAHDSRFEYDLNRDENECLYEEAWGKKVWKMPLTEKEKKLSLDKYRNFYNVIDAIVQKLEKIHGGVLVYDFHSYNYKRHKGKVTPIINIGTENIDKNRYGEIVSHWISELSKIDLPKMKEEVKENAIFFGRGNFLKHLTRKFSNTLVLATEIKKIYCDEETGNEDPYKIGRLANGIFNATRTNTKLFEQKILSNTESIGGKLSKSINIGMLVEVDKNFHDLVRNIDYIDLITPNNLASEKKRFNKEGKYFRPNFVYKKVGIEIRETIKTLYNLPVNKIGDDRLEEYYEKNIDAYINLLTLIGEIGTNDFLYTSIKLFGKPEQKQIKASKYLLHCQNFEDSLNKNDLSSSDIKEKLEHALLKNGLTQKVVLSDQMASNILFYPLKNAFYVRKNIKLKEMDVNALIYREISTHAMPFENARLQPLRIFQLDNPNTVETQEGIGILNEYFSANLTLNRLKMISLRTLAVDHMISEMDFLKTLEFLVENYEISSDDAFQICARVYRGGGFTKDHLYLKGFLKVKDYFLREKLSEDLLIGKTSIDSFNILSKIKEKNLFLPPSFIPEFFNKPQVSNDLVEYVFKGLKNINS